MWQEHRWDISLEIVIDQIVEYYNYYAEKAFPYPKDRELIAECLEIDSSERNAHRYIKWYARYKHDAGERTNFEECFTFYRNLLLIEPQGGDDIVSKAEYFIDECGDIGGWEDLHMKKMSERPKKDTNAPAAPIIDPNKDMSEGLDLISSSVAKLTDSVVKAAIEEGKQSIEQELKNDVMDYVLKTYGPVEKRVSFVFDPEKLNPVSNEKIVHERFGEVLSFVMAREPVYLVGPAGSGKNHICKQVAKTMGIPFYFSNAVTQEYKITGFTDANGTFHESQFYKAFKNGGLFMLDELDASIPEVLVILNAAISNGYFDFPAPIGCVEAHEDFRIIAAGNTYGYGADVQYVGRNQLDMASLDRFAVIEINYSPAIEAELCPDSEMLAFLREYRKAVVKNGIMTAVSYRAMRRLYKMEKAVDSLPELLDICLCKGLCKDDLEHIAGDIDIDSKYTRALGELSESRAY